MHMLIESSDGTDRAYPLFGLNASHKTKGVLMVTARAGSVSTLVGVLPYAPSGQIQNDQTIVTDHVPNDTAIALHTVVPEGGFCIDGLGMGEIQYLFVQGQSTDDVPDLIQIDVSFVPNVIPVEAV